jgi:hypothetical protein
MHIHKYTRWSNSTSFQYRDCETCGKKQEHYVPSMDIGPVVTLLALLLIGLPIAVGISDFLSGLN